MSPSTGRERVDGRLERGILWGTILFGVVPALLLGGVHAPVVTALTAGTAGLVMALAVRGWPGTRPCFRLTIVGAIVAGPCVAAAVQLLPMPPEMIGVLSPAAIAIWEHISEGLGLTTSGWHPLTLAPVQTAANLARDVGALALFGVGATFLGRESRFRWFTLWVAGCGLLLGLLGVAHRLAGEGRIYGFYPLPGAMNPPIVTSFVNHNHLAGYELLAIGCGFALLIADERRAIRVAGALFAAGALATLLATGSRAAVPAIIVGTLVFCALRALSAPPSTRRRWIAAGAALAVLSAAGLAIVLSATNAETGTPVVLSDPKLEPWRDVPTILGSFPGTGLGRGAFHEVYPFFKTTYTRLTFAHLENEALEVLVELGPLFGGAILLALVGVGAWCLWRLRRSGSHCASVAAALSALLVHNLFDFNLRVAGVLFPAALLAGALAGRARPLREERRRTKGWPRLAAPAAMIAALLLAVVLGIWWSRTTLDREEAALAAAAAGGKEPLLRTAAEVVPRHPADSYLLLRVAALLAEPPIASPREAVRWVSRAMYLNPTAGEPHYWAARILYATGRRDQARIEYRLALALWDGEGVVVPEVVRRYATLEDLAGAIPLESADTVNRTGLELDRVGRVADGLGLVERALARAPEDPVLLLRRYHLLMSAKSPREAADVAAKLETLSGTPVERADRALLRAHSLHLAGDTAMAERAARTATEIDPANANGWATLGELLVTTGRAEEAKDLIGRALAMPGVADRDRARLSFVSGQAAAALGSNVQAALAYGDAIRLDPVNPSYRLVAAETYLKIGDTHRAIAEFRAVGAMGGGFAVYAERANELERLLGAHPAPLGP